MECSPAWTGSGPATRDDTAIDPELDVCTPLAPGKPGPGLADLTEVVGRFTLESPWLASFKAATNSTAFCLVASKAIVAHLTLSVLY